jgi:hypothetical protein
MEQVELDPAGDVGDAELAGFLGGEAVGLLGFRGLDPVWAVPVRDLGMRILNRNADEHFGKVIRAAVRNTRLSRTQALT